MTDKYEEVVLYKPVQPKEIIETLPFWWFTDIAISFKNGKKSKTIVYGVSEDELFSLGIAQNPFADISPNLVHRIPYDRKEYPEDRNFNGFPPLQGSPFLRGIEDLLSQNNSSFDDVNMVNGLMRWYSMARGEIWVVSLYYNNKRKSTNFGRVVLDQVQMSHLDKGGIEYLDRVYVRAPNNK